VQQSSFKEDELRGGEERGGGSEGPGRRSAMKRREGGVMCNYRLHTNTPP